MIGNCLVPDRTAAKRLFVDLNCGPIIKRIVVTGNRRWIRGERSENVISRLVGHDWERSPTPSPFLRWTSAGKNLQEAVLNDAVLKGASLNGARLSYALMARADLTEADMQNSDLTQTDLHEIKEEHTLWHGANKRKARRPDKALIEAEKWTYERHLTR